jgi:hypothetical protein
MYIEPENTPYQLKTGEEPKPEPYVKPESTGYQGKKKSYDSADSTVKDIYGCQELKKQQEMIAQKQAQIPIQPIGMTTPFIPPQFQTYLNTFMKNYYTPFIYKDYNISIGGPNADHKMASSIYEDALPAADVFSSYKTVRERNNLIEYIRGIFISVDEGELVDFEDSDRSLTKRLKLLELNPYNPNCYSYNPYEGLPRDMMIYKSCYPITYDSSVGLVQCSKSSVGINMRVYKLTLKELAVKYLATNQKPLITGIEEQINSIIEDIRGKPEAELEKYNVWREVSYYAFIRERINKENICPNFVSSYCYFINRKANMTFNKNGPKSILQNENPNICKGEQPKVDTDFSNSTLIILTESPNMNLIYWSSNLYKEDRGIRKMIYSGFKTAIQWESIIAQMLITFYVMDKYKFTINGMNIQSNFYVKDLNVLGESKQYWQYNINDIDYYIPNLGNLLMVDDNYKDLNVNSPEITQKLREAGLNPDIQTNLEMFQIMLTRRKTEEEANRDINNIEKIMCLILELDTNYKVLLKSLGDNEDVINMMIRNNAINCLSPNTWRNTAYKTMVPPESKIINLLSKIQKDIEEKENYKYKYSFSEIISRNLVKYINNRVGTFIRDLEVPYIKKNDIRPFKKGQIVVYESKFDTYQILLFIKNSDIDDNLCICIADNYNEITVNRDLLYHYSEFEPVKQDLKPGEPMTGIDHIIEKYTL